MEKYQNKYRVQSARLRTWNYNCNASYFITICTTHMENYFGKIENDEMILSEIGKIAEQEWIKTPKIRPDMNLDLDEFIVMPNHFHAIINIGENEYNSNGDDVYRRRDAMHCVSTAYATAAIIQTNVNPRTVNQFGPQSKNLGSILRGYKSAVTQYARIHHIDFGWQPRFHDHIIRDDDELTRIQQYIKNNPANWNDDKYF